MGRNSGSHYSNGLDSVKIDADGKSVMLKSSFGENKYIEARVNEKYNDLKNDIEKSVEIRTNISDPAQLEDALKLLHQAIDSAPGYNWMADDLVKITEKTAKLKVGYFEKMDREIDAQINGTSIWVKTARRADPLALDLDSDGIELVRLAGALQRARCTLRRCALVAGPQPRWRQPSRRTHPPC